MSPIKQCWILFSLFILTSCTSYGPAGESAGFSVGGYSDSRINQNTAIVTFDGNMFTARGTAERYMLYRCAQVTLANGYDYFIISSVSSSPTNISVGARVNYNQYVSDPAKAHAVYSRTEKYRSAYISGTCTEPFTHCDRQNNIGQHASTAVIKMFKGNVLPPVPRAYMATDVIAHLKPSTL